MQANKTGTQALVLGGGGVAGVAWELGILLALSEAGVDVRNADLTIGTSAGSVVGAQITSGAELESLFASQLTSVEQSKERNVTVDFTKMVEVWSQAANEPDSKKRRKYLGAFALTVPTTSEAERRVTIEARLPVQNWPQKNLLIVAVDAETGEEYLMNRETGVSLVDAVGASCAVPGVWPTVTIAGHRYMDGGVRSGTNADLATGYERILILNPMGANANLFGDGPAREAADLERQGSHVLIIEPDAASLAAIGQSPLDPATRIPSAQAGLAQGREIAATLAGFWSHI